MTFNPQTASARAPSNSPVPAPRIWALVPCAGSGSRARTRVPKQYQNVAGQPMVLHTLAAFVGVPAICHTLVVVAEQDRFFEALPAESTASLKSCDATIIIANCGGLTRANSVFNGLNHLIGLGADANDWVLVHDAARCLVAPAQIQALIDACLPDDVGGLLAYPLPDTLKSESGGRVAGTINRSDKWLAQTPQMFRIGPLLAALEAAARAGLAVTDESSAMEACGLQPKLVSGSALNFKVTYPEDFALAEAVLHARARADGVALVARSGAPLAVAPLDFALYDYP